MSRAKLTTAERWARWRDVLDQTVQYCAHAEATGGDEMTFPPEYRRALWELREVDFPVDGRSSDQMAEAFRLQVQALIDVAIPARRVAIAAGVSGSCAALDGLWRAEQSRLTQVQLTRLGAGD